MKHSMIAIVAAALTLTTSASLAADKPAAPAGASTAQEEFFKKLDTNHDGVISKDEWRANGDKMFDDMDTNHDGKVTLEEKKAHDEARQAEWLAKHPRVGTAAATKLLGGSQPSAPAKQ